MTAHDSLIQRLFHHAESNSSHDAVVTADYSLSYSELAHLVRLQANAFAESGLSNDSVIGIQCADDAQHLLLCLGAACIGATSCTVPSYESTETRRTVVEQCGATIVVKESIPIVASLSNGEKPFWADVTPAAQSRTIFSTSGTTGRPKLVVHLDRDLVAQAHRHIQSQEERFACVATVEHNFAKRHRLYCVAMGATNVFIDSESLVKQCQALQVNVLHVSAYQARELLAQPDIAALSGIRLKLGGSHVPHSLRQQLRDKITNHLEAGYGITETGAIAFSDPDDLRVEETVGRPLPGIEIRVVTPEGETLGAGERGELAIRCEGMFREYLGEPERTAERLRDGWFYTGDIGYLDAERRIFLCGRSDDMFVFNSMNIYPQDVESQICQHPDVVDAAVLPKASSIHGSIPVALVVYAEGVQANLPDLKRFVRDRVGVRCPRQITVVEKIPRNDSGKIARREALTRSVDSGYIRRAILNVLDPEPLRQLPPQLLSAIERGEQDIRLHRLGMTSLERMEMLVAVELEFDVVIMPQDSGRFGTLGDVVSHIAHALKEECVTGEDAAVATPTGNREEHAEEAPYCVRLFRRVFSYCYTVAELNKALTSFENRLTPQEVECLYDWHRRGQLIPEEAASKFRHAIEVSLGSAIELMGKSGKRRAEAFRYHRVAPFVTLYTGPGSPSEKTLVICFAARATRRLSMPQAVLLQHTDATQFDLMLVAEPLAANYRLGVPHMGDDVAAMSEYLGRLDCVKAYREIRTLGSSAGAYPALIAASQLEAEMAVCAGGRFERIRRHPGRFLDRLFSIWRAGRKKHCSSVLLAYSINKRRDRIFANSVSVLTGASRVSIGFEDRKVGHQILRELLERGELGSFLERTVFVGADGNPVADRGVNVAVSYPAEK